MKTPFIASVCLLALVLTSVAQSPPPVQSQPGAPGTSPAAQVPTNPAAVNPAAPMQSPATNVPQGQQPAVPQGQQPAVPGASIPVTLSPAPGTATSPAAATGTSPAATTATSPAPAVSPAAEPQPTGFLASNWLISKFHQGGPVMWPILIVSIIGLTVVIERCLWWTGRWFRRDPKRIEKVFTAIEQGDTTEASRLSRGSRDPVLRMMWNGLNHQHTS